MIYGRVISNNSKALPNKLDELSKLMLGPESVTHLIQLGDFSGGIICNAGLPYKKEDYYDLNQEKNTLVLMSGVIYNRDKIIQRLNLNHSPKHDPALVSMAFEAWGASFIKELNGDFAIFIYKKQSNSFYLFRDHMGIKPLAYSKMDDAIWFSSDSMSLCKILYATEKIDQEFLKNLLINFGLQSTKIIDNCSILPNQKVKKVLPGHYVTSSIEGIFENKYWFPEDINEDSQLDFETVNKEIKDLLTDAVKIRSDQRFVASSHLSGGLDSGIVASMARKEFHKQEVFSGFSWTPIAPTDGIIDFDERILVNKLGKHIGVRPKFTVINPEDYIHSLSQWKLVTDLFYEYRVAEKAHKNNINLIFSGWGGDEFVSSGGIGTDSDLIFKFQWLSFIKKNTLKKPKRFIGILLYNVILPALSLRYYTRKKTLACHSKYLFEVSKEKEKTINDFYSWRSRREIHLRFLYQHHISERTEDWNIQGNRSGVEYRYPLIDKRIIELVLKIPSRLLFNNGFGRILIRENSEGILPEEIRWHVSKNDPVRIQALYELEDKVCVQLMNEVAEFKKNPVFDFINFDVLEKDIEEHRKGFIKKRPSEQFEILLFLKKAHEFTKAYYK